MRQTTVLFRKSHKRAPQIEDKVPFRQMHPLKLQDRVSGLAKNIHENNCMYEMSLVFACMKDNNFENHMCEQQIQNFTKCIKNSEAHKKHQKELQKIGVPTPDTVNFTDSQINYLLRKYPTM